MAREKAAPAASAAAAAAPAYGRPSKSKKAPAAPDPTLAADVAAFAARLGLAAARPDAAGGGGGFDDDDFRPEKARQKLAAPATAAAAAPDAGRRGGDASPAAAGRRGAEPRPPHARPGDRRNGGGPLTPDRGGHGQHQSGRPSQHQRASFGLPLPAPGAPPPPPSLLGRDGGAGVPWYEAAEEAVGSLGPDAAAPPPAPPSDALVAAARAAGGALLDAEGAAAVAARARARDADARWLSAAASGGTASDRIAASALLIADRPAGGLAALDDLIKLAGKRAGARGPAAAALDALADLFAGPLLPPGRRLVPLGARNLGAVMGATDAAPPSKAKARVLLFWALEDALKRRASDFMDALGEASRDALPMLRSKAARALAGLLASRPEGEARALAALVNKLGDPARRLASDAAHLLDGVLAAHPAMAPVVADAVEKFALRPGQAERARYTAILFLSTLPLARSGAGAALAARLVDCYFGLFRAILAGGLGHASAAAAAREAKAVANGKNNKRAGKKGRHKARPAPKAGTDADASKPPPPPPAIVAGVDARMLGALLTGVRRAVPFLAPGAAAGLAGRHADALFRVAGAAPLPTAVQALALLFQLLGTKDAARDARDAKEDAPAVSDRWYRALYARLGEAATPRTAKPAPLLSLVYRAAKADPSPPRVAAFLKRLLQSAAATPSAGYAAGCLLLVSEVLKARPALWAMVTQPEEEGEGDTGAAGAPPPPPPPPRPRPTGGDGSSSDEEEEEEAAAPAPPPPPQPAASYDPSKRDPLHARAGGACLWELLPLAGHAHPSVAAFARALLAGKAVAYDGDPLADFTGAAVLDKIVSKKPKARPRAPVLGGAGGSLAAPPSRPAPGTAAFTALAAEAVRPDEAFLHRWHASRAAACEGGGQGGAGRRRRKVGEDDEDGGGGATALDLASDEEDELDDLLAREEGGAGDAGIGADPDRGAGGGGADWEAALADALAEEAVARARERRGDVLDSDGDEDGDGDEPADSGDDEEEEEEEDQSGSDGPSESEDGSGEDSGDAPSSSSGDDGGGDSSDSPFSSGDDASEDEGQQDEDADLGGIPSASGSEEVDTDTSDGEDSDSSGEWVMAPGAGDGEAPPPAAVAEQGKAPARKAGKAAAKRARSDSDGDDVDDDSDAPGADDDFAAADEYEAMIAADERGEAPAEGAGAGGRPRRGARGGGGGGRGPPKRAAPAGRGRK